MNNIEILEMQLKKIKDFCKDNNKHYYVEDLPYYMFWNGKQAEIVENLIQENKELKVEKVLNEKILYFANNTLCNYHEGYQAGLHKEITATAIVAEERERFIIGQEIKRLKDTIHELHNQLDEGNKRVKDDYIPKSKVKEKIEEIKRNDYSSYDTCLCFQELLEEGE